MTASTLDDEPQHYATDGFDPSTQLVANFTIAFWAKAREALNSTQTSATQGIAFLPRGMVFCALANVNQSFRGLGFHLGTDGYNVVWSNYGNLASIAVQRQSLVGWHHYSIVYDAGQAFVYVDGNERDSSSSSKAIDRQKVVDFRLAFGRTRFRWTADGGNWSTGFEGWLSELRLANRSMHGSEALRQIDNKSAWDFSYSMRGCSGENHDGTEIDRFRLQQAWLVCRPVIESVSIDIRSDPATVAIVVRNALVTSNSSSGSNVTVSINSTIDSTLQAKCSVFNVTSSGNRTEIQCSATTAIAYQDTSVRIALTIDSAESDAFTFNHTAMRCVLATEMTCVAFELRISGSPPRMSAVKVYVGDQFAAAFRVNTSRSWYGFGIPISVGLVRNITVVWRENNGPGTDWNLDIFGISLNGVPLKGLSLVASNYTILENVLSKGFPYGTVRNGSDVVNLPWNGDVLFVPSMTALELAAAAAAMVTTMNSATSSSASSSSLATKSNSTATTTITTATSSSLLPTSSTAVTLESANATSVFSRPYSVTAESPVWMFGAVGGGAVALVLLLIGAIALACWCNKRASSQPASSLQMINSNDTNMSSFRETSSSAAAAAAAVVVGYGMLF